MEMRKIRLFIIVTTMVTFLKMGDDGGVMGSFVFKVQNKFKMGGGRNKSLSSAMRAHDIQRHRGRSLAIVNPELGGDGNAFGTALYFTKIGLGTPPKYFHVAVDTGSTYLWVNAVGCSKCPTSTDVGVKLQSFDPSSSSTFKKIDCASPACKFRMSYMSDNEITGYYGKDYLYLPQVTENDKTSSMLNATVLFACATNRSGVGTLTSTHAAIDGIMGLSIKPESMLSQLAAKGKIKNEFAHCLNSDGGGIFALGDVVSPKVDTTPLAPNASHYAIYLNKIDVDGDALQYPTDSLNFDGQDRGLWTILDSGLTTTFFPDVIYQPLMTKILDRQPGLKIVKKTVDEISCFKYTDNIDDKFPAVTFHFENSKTMTIYPHDYLFLDDEAKYWCFGLMNSGPVNKENKQPSFLMLGDVALHDRLVIFDLKNQNVGWIEHDCSSSIKMKDEQSGNEYFIHARDISRAIRMTAVRVLIFISLIVLTI